MRATASGSLPGTDFRGALGFLLEQFPDLAPLPELPERGPGAGMIGRAAALLADVAVELTPHGWSLTDHAGPDARRARALWRRDLDDLEELSQGFTGALKVAVCGPLTLAASLGRPRAEVALADRGARRDIAESLLVGLVGIVDEIGRRVPGAHVAVQVDEPLLTAVLGGQVKTASGYRRLRAVDEAEATELLRPFAGADAVLHCCAGGEWLGFASRCGFESVYVDPSQVGDADALGEWIQAGRKLVLGAVPTATPNVVPPVDEIISAVTRTLRPLGFGPDVWRNQVVLAPACGLATWDRPAAQSLLERTARAAASL